MTEDLANRLRLAHQSRRAKEHQLDDIRRALCDTGIIEDDDPYSHADLADVIRQAWAADNEQESSVRITPDNPAASSDTADNGLREQYAAALRDAHREWLRPGSDAGQHLMADHMAAAAMAVRDRRMEQLVAGRETWKAKAAEIEAHRDRIAAALREVLDQFADWPAGGTFWPEPGVVAKVSAEDWDRWDAVIAPADEPGPADA